MTWKRTKQLSCVYPHHSAPPQPPCSSFDAELFWVFFLFTGISPHPPDPSLDIFWLHGWDNRAPARRMSPQRGVSHRSCFKVVMYDPMPRLTAPPRILEIPSLMHAHVQKTLPNLPLLPSFWRRTEQRRSGAVSELESVKTWGKVLQAHLKTSGASSHDRIHLTLKIL